TVYLCGCIRQKLCRYWQYCCWVSAWYLPLAPCLTCWTVSVQTYNKHPPTSSGYCNTRLSAQRRYYDTLAAIPTVVAGVVATLVNAEPDSGTGPPVTGCRTCHSCTIVNRTAEAI